MNYNIPPPPALAGAEARAAHWQLYAPGFIVVGQQEWDAKRQFRSFRRTSSITAWLADYDGNYLRDYLLDEALP